MRTAGGWLAAGGFVLLLLWMQHLWAHHAANAEVSYFPPSVLQQLLFPDRGVGKAPSKEDWEHLFQQWHRESLILMWGVPAISLVCLAQGLLMLRTKNPAPVPMTDGTVVGDEEEPPAGVGRRL